MSDDSGSSAIRFSTGKVSVLNDLWRPLMVINNGYGWHSRQDVLPINDLQQTMFRVQLSKLLDITSLLLLTPTRSQKYFYHELLRVCRCPCEKYSRTHKR